MLSNILFTCYFQIPQLRICQKRWELENLVIHQISTEHYFCFILQFFFFSCIQFLYLNSKEEELRYSNSLFLQKINRHVFNSLNSKLEKSSPKIYFLLIFSFININMVLNSNFLIL